MRTGLAALPCFLIEPNIFTYPLSVQRVSVGARYETVIFRLKRAFVDCFNVIHGVVWQEVHAAAHAGGRGPPLLHGPVPRRAE